MLDLIRDEFEDPIQPQSLSESEVTAVSDSHVYQI